MKYYSDFTTKYVQDICDALNKADIKMRLYGGEFIPEKISTLTHLIEQQICYSIVVYTFLNEKGLVNRGFCPYTGERIFDTSPSYTNMGSKKVYVSPTGLEIMQKESAEEYERIVGKPKPQKSSKGCYIATVCYENENAIEVLLLKKFRDESLSKSYIGNLLIKIYYTFSPFIAKKMKDKLLFNNLIRRKLLDKIVTRLHKNNS